MLPEERPLHGFAPARPPNAQSAPDSTGFPVSEGSLEFELTDIVEARRILDDESMSQFDGSSVAHPEQWKRLRRSTVPTDRAITGQAIDWMLALPPSLRPQLLSRQFPRIVNALAQVWNEPAECQAALDKLLSSERPQRAGFPPGVREELVALRNWTQVF